MSLYQDQWWEIPQPGLSPEPGLLHAITCCPQRHSHKDQCLDIPYTKVHKITSLSIPLAEAEILVRNAHFLQCIDVKRKVGFDECGLVPFPYANLGLLWP